MELYLLDSEFKRQDPLEELLSVIWTERYIGPGNMEIDIVDTPVWRALLYENSFIALEGTDEVMWVQTREIKEGQIKLTGTTLDQIFADRFYRNVGDVPTQSTPVVGTPGRMMGEVAARTLGSDTSWFGGLEYFGYEKNSLTNIIIPNFYTDFPLVGESDDTGAWAGEFPASYGPALDIIKNIAETFQVGFSLHLKTTPGEDYQLVFSRYKGRDLTSGQTTYDPVQFSPIMDNLTDLTELRSIVGYRNIAYAYPTNFGAVSALPPGVAYADSAAEDSIDFNRRTMLIYVSDIPWDDETPGTITDNYNAHFLPTLNLRAREALANNNYIRMVDGEIVPQPGIKYGVNYKLGDIVELIGTDGTRQAARITEYIRSQDAEGRKEYPTVSLIE